MPGKPLHRSVDQKTPLSPNAHVAKHDFGRGYVIVENSTGLSGNVVFPKKSAATAALVDHVKAAHAEIHAKTPTPGLGHWKGQPRVPAGSEDGGEWTEG